LLLRRRPKIFSVLARYGRDKELSPKDSMTRHKNNKINKEMLIASYKVAFALDSGMFAPSPVHIRRRTSSFRPAKLLTKSKPTT